MITCLVFFRPYDLDFAVQNLHQQRIGVNVLSLVI